MNKLCRALFEDIGWTFLVSLLRELRLLILIWRSRLESLILERVLSIGHFDLQLVTLGFMFFFLLFLSIYNDNVDERLIIRLVHNMNSTLIFFCFRVILTCTCIYSALKGGIISSSMKSYRLSELGQAEVNSLKARPRIDFSSIFGVVSFSLFYWYLWLIPLLNDWVFD